MQYLVAIYKISYKIYEFKYFFFIKLTVAKNCNLKLLYSTTNKENSNKEQKKFDIKHLRFVFFFLKIYRFVHKMHLFWRSVKIGFRFTSANIIVYRTFLSFRTVLLFKDRFYYFVLIIFTFFNLYQKI